MLALALLAGAVGWRHTWLTILTAVVVVVVVGFALVQVRAGRTPKGGS